MEQYQVVIGPLSEEQLEKVLKATEEFGKLREVALLADSVGSKDDVGLTNYGVLIIDTDGSVTKNDTLKSSFDGADRFSQPWRR